MPSTIVLVPNVLRVRADESAGKLYLEWYDSSAATWKVIWQVDIDTGDIDVIGKLLQDLTINKDTPAVKLTGTETDGIDLHVRENAGAAELYDNTNARTLLKADGTTITDVNGVALASHGSRHAYGGADAIPADGLRFSQIDKVFGSTTTLSVSASSTATIDKGIYYVFCGPNTSVEVYDATNDVWRTLIPAGGAGLVISDGTNVRLNNAATVAEDSYLIPIE